MIDPSIALGIRPPQFQSPMQTLADVMQLRNMQEQQRRQQQQDQLATMLVQKTQRENDDDLAYRDATKQFTDLQSGDTDWLSVERNLLGKGLVDPAKKARAEHDLIIRNEDAQAKSDLVDLGVRLKRATPGFQAALDIYDPKDPATLDKAQSLYDTAMSRAQDIFSIEKPGPNGTTVKTPTPLSQWLGQLPAKFDPDKVNQLIASGETVEESQKRQLFAVDRSIKAAQAVKEGEDARRLQKEGVAAMLSTSSDQAHWDSVFAAARGRNVPADILDGFPKEWSTDAVQKAKEKSMLPKDWLAVADREEALGAREAAADAAAQLRQANYELAVEKWNNRTNAPGKDDPKLPRGVMDAIVSQRFADKFNNDGSVSDAAEQASKWLVDNMDALRHDHPSLDLGKARSFSDKFYKESPAQAMKMYFGSPSTESAPPPPPPLITPARPVAQAAPATQGAIPPGIQPAAPSTKPRLTVGQSVKLKSGKTVTVTAVHPDGTFDAQ